MTKDNKKITEISIDDEGKSITRKWSDGTETVEELKLPFEEYARNQIGQLMNKSKLPIGLKIYRIEKSIRDSKRHLKHQVEWEALKVEGLKSFGVSKDSSTEELKEAWQKVQDESDELSKRQRILNATRSELRDILVWIKGEPHGKW